MTAEPECAICALDHDLYVYRWNASGQHYAFCARCASHEIIRHPHGAWHLIGTYLQVMGDVTDRHLENYLGSNPRARAAAESMTEVVERSSESMRQGAAIGQTLELLFDMPSDAVLDEYNEQRHELARVCGNISPVVSYGNTFDYESDALSKWRTLRADAVGG